MPPTKPALRSIHRLIWHPAYGDVRRSDVYATIEATPQAGPWIRVTGQPVLVVTRAEWARMVGEGADA